MKLPRLLTVIVTLITLTAFTGCQTPIGKACSAETAAIGRTLTKWWKSPGTQQGLSYAMQAAQQFAMQLALASVQQYASTGKVDLKTAAQTGGIAVLYQQASNIRQLQGTSMVLDPVATANLLAQGGAPKDVSQKLAQQLFDNATALIKVGATPNQAAEVQAAGIDAAAAKLTVLAGAPLP